MASPPQLLGSLPEVDVKQGFWLREPSTPEYWRMKIASADEVNDAEVAKLYEQHAVDSNRFRLIRLLPSALFHDPIQCEFVVEPQNTLLKYTAISYSWGDGVWTQIMVNGRRMRVSLRVYAALSRLRLRDEPILIWIDAICIHQTDNTEKSQQVQAMRRIYENAAELVIWLGDGPDEQCTMGLELLHRVALAARCPHSQALPCEDCTAQVAANVVDYFPNMEAWQVVGIALRNEWWKRTWVVQELLVAKNASVLFGPAAIRWSVLELAMSYVTNIHRRIIQIESERALAGEEQTNENGPGGSREPQAESTPRETSTISMTQRIRYIVEQCYDPWLVSARRTLQLEGGFDLFQLLVDTSRRQASDPRDKLFGIIHLVKGDLPQALLPDYDKPASTLYKELAQHLIASKNCLDLLLCTYPDSSFGLSVPSWCQNWSPEPALEEDVRLVTRFKERLSFCRQAQTEYAAGGALAALPRFSDDLETLTLPGSRLDEVMMAGSFRPLTGKDPEEPHYHLKSKFSSGQIIEDMSMLYPYGGTYYDVYRRLFDIKLPDQRWSIGTKGWPLFVTKSRLLGFALGPIQKDDVVCLLYGGKTPFVLRPQPVSPEGVTRFKFVCCCYIDGVMHGELVNPENPNKVTGSDGECDFVLI